MFLSPHIRVAYQVVYNRSLEKIVKHIDPKGEYIDPVRFLNQKIFAQEIGFEKADKFVPFLEILILRGISGSFSYRLIIDHDENLTLALLKQIDNCFQEVAADFEKEEIDNKGHIFYDESVYAEKEKKRQREYERKFKLAQIIRNTYSELMAKISQMLKDGRRPVYIAKEVGLSEKKTKENLYSTTSGKPTISTLVKKILGDSDAAKKLGIRDGQRLYDEIISRSEFEVFHKLKKTFISKKIIVRL